MPFYFKHSGKQIDLEDLPLARWVTIQEQTGRQWHEVLGANVLGDAKVASAVAEQAAAELGIELPALSLRQMLDVIVFQPADNLPAQYEDGIPDPKAAATEQATI